MNMENPVKPPNNDGKPTGWRWMIAIGCSRVVHQNIEGGQMYRGYIDVSKQLG